MKFNAVLNSDGGTLRTLDIDDFAKTMGHTLEAAGHSVDVDIVAGKDIEQALAKAASRRNVDVVLVGGGDGTVSAAAGMLMGKSKALAILPAGTMNLFARSLQIPLGLDAAISAFASGEVRQVDIATANGRPFVHQFSIGMHAKMVHLREKMEFGSRFGKMRASAKAAYATFLNPPTMRVEIRIGGVDVRTKTTGIGITNNLFGEGTLPYAEKPDGGVLGVYITVAQQRRDLAGFFVNLARGRWRSNPHVEIHQAAEVELKLLSNRTRDRCVVDGELVPLDRGTVVKIHPKALKVLTPCRK